MSFPRVMHLLGRFTRRAITTVVALAVGAVTLGLAAVTLLPNVGIRAMVVTSGSMEPAINVGGLVLVEEVDPDAIAPGDVITFEGYSGEGLTTHRVLARRVVNDRVHFQTQGDANDTPDADLAPAEGVVGRAAFDLPYAGRAMSELQRPRVRLLAIGAPALWLFARNALLLARTVRARRPALLRDRRPAAGTAVVVAVALVVTVVLHAADPRPSAARLRDAVTVTDNRFVTGSW